MKAEEVPEKLYFGESDKGILDIYSDREPNDEVEYTRTDAFIEKACDFISSLRRLDDDVIEDFKKYMKGE